MGDDVFENVHRGIRCLRVVIRIVEDFGVRLGPVILVGKETLEIADEIIGLDILRLLDAEGEFGLKLRMEMRPVAIVGQIFEQLVPGDEHRRTILKGARAAPGCLQHARLKPFVEQRHRPHLGHQEPFLGVGRLWQSVKAQEAAFVIRKVDTVEATGHDGGRLVRTNKILLRLFDVGSIEDLESFEFFHLRADRCRRGVIRSQNDRPPGKLLHFQAQLLALRRFER